MANGTIAVSSIEMESQSGTGIVTINPPATNTNRTLTLPDAAGVVVTDTATQTLTNKTLTTPNIDSAQFATVSGTAPIYPCRAWVNFNGTGTVAIRASGNVSSITDNNTGDYTVNFTTAMVDANYAVCTTAGNGGTGNALDANNFYNNTNSTTTCRCVAYLTSTGVATDASMFTVAIFR